MGVEEKMDYRNLGRSGLRVSALCLGCMSFGRWIDEPTARRVVDAAIEQGINFFDTADIYGPGMDGGEFAGVGASEEILGRALAGRRGRAVVATKVRHPVGPGPNDAGLSRLHIMAAVEASLRRLRTDYIDLYQIHSPDPGTPWEETLRALDDLVRQGKVRYVGCSNVRAWQLVKALWVSDRHGLERFISVQPPYSILRREAEAELFPACLSEGVGALVYSPLARGMLSGRYAPGSGAAGAPPGSRAAHDRALLKLMTERNFRIVEGLRPLAAARGCSPAQFALAWALGHPAVSSAIVGITRVEQVAELAAAAGWRLSADERDAVDRLCAAQPG